MSLENDVERMTKYFREKGIPHDPGYIYVLKAENGLYKIGKTKNVKKRISAIKTASPVKIEIHLLFQSSDMNKAEGMLHEMFSEFREIGEWFRIGEKEFQRIYEREGDHILLRCYM